MKNYTTTHPFSNLAWLAVPLLLLMVIMGRFFPATAPDGFDSFIIAFEFAKTPEDIQSLFGGLTQEQIQQTDTGNYIDFAFMLTYCLFLFFFTKKAAVLFQKKFLWMGISLILVILGADFLENLKLLSITEIYSQQKNTAPLNPLLHQLHVITWIKWGGLAALFVLLFFGLEKYRMWHWIAMAILWFPVATGFWAFGNQPHALNVFTLSVFTSFGALLVYSIGYKRSGYEPDRTSRRMKTT